MLGDDVNHGADVEADPGDPVEDQDGAQHHVVVPVHVWHCLWCLHHPRTCHDTKYGNILLSPHKYSLITWIESISNTLLSYLLKRDQNFWDNQESILLQLLTLTLDQNQLNHIAKNENCNLNWILRPVVTWGWSECTWSTAWPATPPSSPSASCPWTRCCPLLCHLPTIFIGN